MFGHIASFAAILNCSLISTKSAMLAKNKLILHFSYCSYLPLGSSYQFTNFILPTKMVKLKWERGHPWIHDLSLAYMAMVQREALENWSAKFFLICTWAQVSTTICGATVYGWALENTALAAHCVCSLNLCCLILSFSSYFLHHPASSAAVDFRGSAVLGDKPKAILQSRSSTLLWKCFLLLSKGYLRV